MNLPARFGKYELIEHLATGGMAEVFLARSFGAEGFEKRLVIKRILPGLAHSPRFVSMFVKEAKISAGLAHPNIVQIYELGKVGDDHYMAMEHIHGRDLTRITRTLRQEQRRMPLPLAVYTTACLLRGLAYAHAATDACGRPLNLVHRDVSPHNVMVSFQGEVKLFDFGIARLVGETTGESEGGARPGGGKFAYMSPEQARGEALDRRSDIFSAGVVLYELLVGHKLYLDPDMTEKLRKVQQAEIPDPREEVPEIPDELVRILRRLLARLPEDRYSRAEEAEEDLWAFLYRSGARADAAAMAGFMRQTYGEASEGRPGMVDLEGLAADLRRLEHESSEASEATGSFEPVPDTGSDSIESGETPRPRLHPGERKAVVVLVAEVVGLTDISARFDPEQVVRSHLKFLRRARRAVGRFGGRLESWQDDTLIVFFGVPCTDELDLERGLGCAIELCRIAERMEKHGLRMNLSIGIHRGEITVGAQNGRHLRYLAAGDTVKLARRLCYEADVGQILVSQDAARLGAGRFVFEPGPKLRVKGEREAQRAWVLTGRQQRDEGPRGRWLRRGEELDVLRLALEQLGQEKSGLLAIRGDAGTGKTRLLREIKALARPRGVPLFSARAVPYGGEGPLSPFRELVADVVGIEGGEPPAVLRERLDRLAQLHLSDADRAVVAALFAVDLGEQVATQAPGAIFRVATALVRGLVEQGPVIVALEDIQHLRDEERVLMGRVIEATRGDRVLFLLTGREAPSSMLGQPDWTIELGPLDERQQKELVLDLVPPELGTADGVGEALAGLIVRTSGGNPLYIESVVSALCQARRLEVKDGEARLVEPERDLGLPPGLDGLISARVDALPGSQKEALQLAAIIGTSFSPALLAASLGRSQAGELVGSLVENGLLVWEDGGPDGRCSFANSLIWEAVRRSTVDVRRRDLHRMVVDGLRRIHGEDLDPVREPLARHCAGAGLFVEAAEHIDRAGDRLRKQQLVREAGACWDRAVGWLGAARRVARHSVPTELEGRIRIKAGAAWALAGEPSRAEMHLQVALEMADEGCGPGIEARAQLELGRLFRSQGRFRLARLHLEMALQSAEGCLSDPGCETGDHGAPAWARPVAVGALEGLGLLAHDRGETNDAEAFFDRARELAAQDDGLRARALHGLALRYVREGVEERALELLDAALAGARAAGDRILAGRIINNIGIVHHGAGRYRLALEHFREALEIRQGLGYHNGVVINLHNIGDTHLRLGDRARAWAAFGKSRDLARESRWERGVMMNEVFLAWLDLEEAENEERWQAAYERLVKATRRARELADPETALTGAWLQGRALRDKGRQTDAARVLHEALQEAESLDAGPIVRDLRGTLQGCEGAAPA